MVDVYGLVDTCVRVCIGKAIRVSLLTPSS